MLLFQTKGQDNYVKYQTFDEYKMEGIGTKKIKRPYVLVKKENDVIFVKKIEKNKGTNECNCVEEIKYINKGDYWYAAIKSEPNRTSSKRSRRIIPMPCTPIFYEKFIFSDTVVEYKYIYSLKNSIKRLNQFIYINTKEYCIILSIEENEIKNQDEPYNEIEKLVANYKEIFPLHSSSNSSRYYSVFEKHIEKDILSIYEINGENKKFISSKKMNNLGEFDNNGTMAWWW